MRALPGKLLLPSMGRAPAVPSLPSCIYTSLTSTDPPISWGPTWTPPATHATAALGHIQQQLSHSIRFHASFHHNLPSLPRPMGTARAITIPLQVRVHRLDLAKSQSGRAD